MSAHDTAPQPTSSGADRSILQSVQRAARVLNELAHRRGPVSVAELAASLGVDRTIVHRLMKTLLGEGLVEQSREGYKIGPQALLLGNAYLDSLVVRQLALPYSVGLLDRVLKDRPWTVSLMMPIGSEMTVVETVWNIDAPLEMQLSMGRRFDIAVTAAGRSILAYSSAEEVESYVGAETAKEQEPELARIRESHGLAFVRDFVPGGSAMAAAILDSSEKPVAALLLAGLDLEALVRAFSAPSKSPLPR